MAYEQKDISSVRFLAANIVYQLTGRMMGGGNAEDADAADDAALLMDMVSSYFTESDPVFHKEWAIIQAARASDLERGYLPGENDPAKDLDYRFREMKAMFRCLCRKGQFVDLAPPKTTWEPTQ